jgi:hypothetical protein
MMLGSDAGNVRGLVCGWSKRHDEAVDALDRLFVRGYRFGLTRRPPEDGTAGLLVFGGTMPHELKGSPDGAAVRRRAWEAREVMLAVYAAALFNSVEMSLARGSHPESASHKCDHTHPETS